MNRLLGLSDYLAEYYGRSVFQEAVGRQERWTLWLHGGTRRTVRIVSDATYDITVAAEDGSASTLPKLQIKMLHRPPDGERIARLVKTDPEVRTMALEPIPAPGQRRHVKNKSLFPLMQERGVVFFTLLEGEVLRGLVLDFTRYEITLGLKGGLPVTLMRHSVFDLRDKQGRCYLKSVQEMRRDWQKSPLFQPAVPSTG